MGAQPESSVSEATHELDGVVIGNDAIGRYKWPREKAVDFGLSQLTKLVDYVFLATMAMLGIMVKSTVFDRLNAKAADQPCRFTRCERLLIATTMLLLGCSLLLGIAAYGMFPRLITDRSFSLNDPSSWLVFAQYATCGLGACVIGAFCLLRLWKT